jgi:F0F1-type ATP synthase assembly protein I
LGRALGGYGPLFGIGMSIAVSLGLSLYAGYRLDRRFGTEPVWFLIGAAFGMFAAFYQLYKAYRLMGTRKK